MKIVQGHIDRPLIKEGEEQAMTLRAELKDIKFDSSFSSDLVRAYKTAEIVLLEKELVSQTTEILRERNYGDYQGEPYHVKEVYDQLVTALSDSERFSHKSNGVESDEEIVTRLTIFLRESAIANPGKTILISTHGDMIHKFLIHLGFGTYHNFPLTAVGNTAYVKVESDGVDFFIKETKRIQEPDFAK